jgi:hypothetical protein
MFGIRLKFLKRIVFREKLDGEEVLINVQKIYIKMYKERKQRPFF